MGTKKNEEKGLTKKQKMEVIDIDYIIATAEQIENMKDEELFLAVKDVVENQAENEFKLGGLLAKINLNGLYQEYEGKTYPLFKDFVLHEFGFSIRKAQYLIAMYEGLVNADVPWDKVKSVGWGKLKELVAVLTNENVDEWVEKAMGMTQLQLIEEVKQAKQLPAPPGEEEPQEPGKKISSLVIKVDQDQKEDIKMTIEKWKAKIPTKQDAVALTFICAEADGLVAANPKGSDLKTMMKKSDPKTVLDLFDDIFPDWSVHVTPPAGYTPPEEDDAVPDMDEKETAIDKEM